MADAATPAPPSAFSTDVQRIKTDVGIAWDYYESPVTDAAAVIGVEAAWLTGLLLALKVLATGIWYEFRKIEE